MAKKRKVLWSNMINLSGLYSDKPVRCRDMKDRYGEARGYWDRTGNFCTSEDQIGEHVLNDGAVVQFTSRSKEEVEFWTRGAKAALAAVVRFCKTG